MTGGAVFWDEHDHSCGVVLEFCFAKEHARDAFRDSPLRSTAGRKPSSLSVDKVSELGIRLPPTASVG